MARIPHLLPTRQAAELKGVSVQGILNAARRGAFESVEVGRFTHVIDDAHFKKWLPRAEKQRAGKLGWKSRKEKRRNRP